MLARVAILGALMRTLLSIGFDDVFIGHLCTGFGHLHMQMNTSDMLESDGPITYLQVTKCREGGETWAGLLGPRCYTSVVATRAMTSRVATTNSAVAENDIS